MQRRALAAAISSLAIGWATLGSARAATYVQFDSEPGDYIGAGISRTFTPPDVVITATASAGGDFVDVTIGSFGFFTIDVDSPSGTPLAPGEYDGATRYPFNPSNKPGLDVSGDGRGCNTLTGRFIVREAVFSGTTVEHLAIDLEQHCEGGIPALFAFVRIDSDVPIPDTDGDGVVDIEDNCPTDPNADQGDVDGDGIGNVCDPVQGVTLIHLDSQAGDFVGQGKVWNFTVADGFITARRTFGGGVLISFRGSDDWSLEFDPPTGTPFGPGTYENAERAAFHSPTKPGLDVSGAGGGCNTLTGRFVVLEAVFTPSGDVTHFAADFEQHCEGVTPALFGVVRFNATNVPPGFDRDGDGIVDPADNCPDVPNADQANQDGDRRGDACDPYPASADDIAACIDDRDRLLRENAALRAQLTDDDGDGVPNNLDRCPTSPTVDVDASGCTQEEFCAGFVLRKFCRAADWRNDEPTRAHDCTWIHGVGCRSAP